MFLYEIHALEERQDYGPHLFSHLLAKRYWYPCSTYNASFKYLGIKFDSHGKMPELVLGRITKGLLQAFDTKARDAIRTALRLPNDTPCSFFYAPLKSDGYRFMWLAEAIPRFTLKRIRSLEKSNDGIVIGLFQAESIREFERRCFDILGINTVGEALCYTNRQRVGDLYEAVVPWERCEITPRNKTG